jgi:phenylacetate-CoA ligase
MNVEWLNRLPAPARRALYFSIQRAIGSRISATWSEFLGWEKFSPSQLDAAVDTRLGNLLTIASAQSEYYRSLGLVRRPSETAIAWLRRFPTLGRPTVRENFARVVIDPLRAEITSPSSVSRKRYDWLVVKTGGTTGVPTTVVHDARARDWGRVTRLYGLRQSGFPLGIPYFRLWGSEPELFNQQAALYLRVLRNLHGEIPLNAFRAKESELQKHYATVLAHPQVHHMMTYVDAAVGFALFIQDKKLQRPKLDSIMACAGTLTPEYRQILQETFSAQIFDKYGSRDCCDMACECSAHNGLHVLSPNAYLEIVDDSGAQCPPGKVGRILVTLLNNSTFPMIRYEVGDLGVWAEPTPCPCGSPFPRMRGVQGRQDDMLVTEDGTLQSSVFVRHFVGVSLNRQLIREWQLEQTGRTEFVFRYIPLANEGLADNLQRLHASFQKVFGTSASIEMREVSEIPPSASGKIRWIINTYRKTQNAG